MSSAKWSRKLRVGGPWYGQAKDPQSLVDYHLRLGFSAAFDPANRFGGSPFIQDPVLLDEIVAAYAEADIMIAETEMYSINILEPDEAKHEQNVQAMCKRMERAEKIGARMVVGGGGNIPLSRGSRGNPENFSQAAIEKMVRTIQRVVDTVKPVKTKYGLETEAHHLPDNPDVYLEIIKAVDRPAFGAHLDPTNIITSPRRFYFNGDFLRDCFAKLGPYIISCHAKDVQVGRGARVMLGETFVGNGHLDYDVFLSEIMKLEADVPLMIEHLNARQLPWARDYVYEKAKGLGITIKHSEFREIQQP